MSTAQKKANRKARRLRRQKRQQVSLALANHLVCQQLPAAELKRLKAEFLKLFPKSEVKS